MVERAFQANQRNASAANALCELFIRKGQHSRVRAFISTHDGGSDDFRRH